MPQATLARRNSPATREFKSLFGGETKVLTDEGEGIVEAIVSVTGIEDRVGDVIVPGAYEKTLQQRWPKGVSHHDWETPVAKALSVRELLPGDPDLPKTTARGEPWPREAGAVMVKMQYNLNTGDGRDAFETVKFFEEEQEWSIGYNVPRGGSRMVKGVRFIDTLDWYEFSDVLFGAAPLTGTHDVKSLGGLVVAGGIESKALPGSYEERSRMLEQAVRQALVPEPAEGQPFEWVMIRGTYDNRVVVCHEKGNESQDYEITYAIVGDEVTLGAPRPVKVVESVVADDAAPEPATSEDAPADEAPAEPSEYKDDEAVETKAAAPKDDGDKPKPTPGDEAEPDPADEGEDDEDEAKKKADEAKAETAYISPSELALYRDMRDEFAEQAS